jgi:hypothetical protein
MTSTKLIIAALIVPALILVGLAVGVAALVRLRSAEGRLAGPIADHVMHRVASDERRHLA